MSPISLIYHIDFSILNFSNQNLLFFYIKYLELIVMNEIIQKLT